MVNLPILASNVVGEVGRGVYILMAGLDVERGLASSGCLG